MAVTLSDISISDAETIAQDVVVPAMQNGPLYRVMFLQSDTMSDMQRKEIIQWYATMVSDAFEGRKEIFLKACTSDGALVGFCGWTIVEQTRNSQIEVKKKGQTNQQKKVEKPKKLHRESRVPEVIDESAWISLSNNLRTERNRVLKNLDGVCRLTFMAVNPDYQRRGIGSMMMQWICKETDQHKRSAYVLAAPEGVPLYKKFSFETVGHVETIHGTITSMLRPAQKL